ncbi:pentatricopeptide repeat-containing protein [Tripterygium wilfordii]|uniref:Pentatricopeptide repeat-containing protein n=1 Tax=Tripterygium wilfordii TaxID=458696 RepID=A0A7J7C3C9_TRIWF|nr:pentatricopeptide repeat-containing protein [Tripterygium wilfordii]
MGRQACMKMPKKYSVKCLNVIASKRFCPSMRCWRLVSILKEFDKVDRLFKDLPKELSIEPDLVSYNTVIKAFSEMGSLESGVSMVQEMEKKGFKADLITFNTLLSGSYRSGRFEEGEGIGLLY